MRYYSTNGRAPVVKFREALFRGLAPDGGLYLPESIPVFDSSFFTADRSYPELAAALIRPFVEEEIPPAVLTEIAAAAFTFPVPLVDLEPGTSILELFHGPTLAFKDFAARFMARTMAYFQDRLGRELTVLVATSGDTGSAVAAGFYGIAGIRVVILYPAGRVSPLQEQQLTAWGGNVTALEIAGSFDDCQRLVKQAFLDWELLSCRNLTSANSINIGRLLPQAVYYAWAWRQVREQDVVFSVPSGNFGNLTGGLIAVKMGLPTAGFVAAVNANTVFPDYLRTGDYRPRPARSTISNAMDVGDPSNFQRIRALFGDDPGTLRREVSSFGFSDRQTLMAIRDVYERTGYILDPHTAVGYLGWQRFRRGDTGNRHGIVLATAHPAKFRDCYPEKIREVIAEPQRLTEFRRKSRQVQTLPTDYSAFKEFLLD
ncbi:MAG: threonine synthase [Candidatus Neomarinimicrobiota bacterium]